MWAARESGDEGSERSDDGEWGAANDAPRGASVARGARRLRYGGRPVSDDGSAAGGRPVSGDGSAAGWTRDAIDRAARELRRSSALPGSFSETYSHERAAQYGAAFCAVRMHSLGLGANARGLAGLALGADDDDGRAVDDDGDATRGGARRRSAPARTLAATAAAVAAAAGLSLIHI